MTEYSRERAKAAKPRWQRIAMLHKGGSSLRDIAALLTAETGKPITHQAVAKLIAKARREGLL